MQLKRNQLPGITTMLQQKILGMSICKHNSSISLNETIESDRCRFFLIRCCFIFSDLRTRRKADHSNDFEDETHNKEKKHSKSIRGRRTRKGRKRTNSDALKSISSSQAFKLSFHQKRKSSNKFKPLNRNPRQQKSRPSSDALKVITSNQIVQVSQEKDRKYHFE